MDEYLTFKKNHLEWIWRESELRPISDATMLRSADRAGYYITATPLENR